jgi:hypothetical protein
MGKTTNLKPALILFAASALSGAQMQGAERGFDDVVRAISETVHARPQHIPFFGLINFAAFVAHPAGVKHLNLAVFENLDVDDRAAKDVGEAIRSVDRGWLPFVRVNERGETVLVYMAQDRSDCRLLVAVVENGELTVVELKLNPEAMQVWLREPNASAVRTVSR